MKVICLSNFKGGAGKTTLAGHLAVQAGLSGYGEVVLIDTDPQASLTDWWNLRKADTPRYKKVELTELTKDLADLKEAGIKLVVIDTPPAVSETIRAVVEVADLVIIPCRPSPHDFRAVSSTVELVDGLKKPFIFVMNGAAVRAKITADTAYALAQYGKVAPVTVFQRTDFAQAMIDGRTAQELDSQSRSANEMAELWAYVRKQLRT
ncbi:MAG: ParA family protein [Burkholderiaceae bacterium]